MSDIVGQNPNDVRVSEPFQSVEERLTVLLRTSCCRMA
jgi:hypothetical protein